jgi:DNA polymerase-3 subunit alpha (Gram-positive type)
MNNEKQYQRRIIFYDFETTGLNPFEENVIDFCFRENDTIIQGLVNTDKLPLSKEVADITGITNDMIKDAPDIMTYKQTILDLLTPTHPNDKTYLVAHNNNRFDRFFLQRMLRSFGTNTKELNIYFIDTMDIAKCGMPFMRSISLKTLCKYFSIPEGTHRALSDVNALESVYYQLIIKLANQIKIKTTQLLGNPELVYSILYV